MNINFNLTAGNPLPLQNTIKQGTSAGSMGKIDVNSLYFSYNGQPILPVMGEFHYSRFSPLHWEESILKMKACHIQIIASYIIWIHHEEIEGQWDFSGCRDLRNFLLLCKKHDMKVLLRIGPWAHAEARNGGFPDWLVREIPPERLRSNDPVYLKKTTNFYKKIYEQVNGLLFKNDGPVIAIQLENEYKGSGTHLKTLKEIALSIGFDTPFYTATAWGCNGYSDIPAGEMIPAFGGYADAPWAEHTNKLHRKEQYIFTNVKNDTIIGSDLHGTNESAGKIDTSLYPYITCELGTGVQPVKHRRPLISTDDMLSMAYAKLGSGLNLVGYYMFHGGTNPNGKLTTLQESTQTGYPNDLPIKNYDFEAPIGAYGLLKDSYFHYRLLHLFLEEFGSRLADTKTILYSHQDKLRCSVRVNGNSGFLFVNNYQRYSPMKKISDVQFFFDFGNETLCFPKEAVTIPEDCYFIFPFHLSLDGIDLIYATAQPVCSITTEGIQTYVFFSINGIAPEYAFHKTAAVHGAAITSQGDCLLVYPSSGKNRSFTVTQGKNTIRIITLTKEEALSLHKIKEEGNEALVLSSGVLLQDETYSRLLLRQKEVPSSLWIYGDIRPWAPLTLTGMEGVFERFALSVPAFPANSCVSYDQTSIEGCYRICIDFSCLASVKDCLLHIRYTGESIALYADNELVADQFYIDGHWDISLGYLYDKLKNRELTIKIAPLEKNADIFLEKFPQIDPLQKAQCLLGIDTEYEIQINLIHK